MTLRCERCETPLPERVPGFSLVTCRQCGTTARVPDREEPHPSAPLPSGRPRGISPTFKVHEDKGVLSVGWDNPSYAALWLPVGWIVFLALLPARMPAVFDQLRQPVPAAVAGALTLLIIYFAIATSINITCVEVRGHALSIVTRPLPMPRSQAVDTRQLTSAFFFSYELRMARGTIVETRHAVSVRTREGRVLRLVDNLPHERDAEWLTSFLSERLGLQDEGRP